MVSAAMPNTRMDTPLRRIEPSARARCSRRSMPAACTATAALCIRPLPAAKGSAAVAAPSVILLITRCATARTIIASKITNAIRNTRLSGPAT